MKTFRHILLALAVVLTAASCGVSKVKDISITSMGISYIVPTSTRSMDAKLVIGIDNPARSFAVQEITGTVKYNDKPLAHFVTGTLELEGKSTQEYELHGNPGRRSLPPGCTHHCRQTFPGRAYGRY